MDSKIHTVCLEMINQRGYKLIENLPDRICAVKPDGERFYILLLEMLQFNVNSLIRCTAMMKELDTKHVLITYQDRASSQAVKAIERMGQGLSIKIDESNEVVEPMTIELFLEENLQYNITKHKISK